MNIGLYLLHAFSTEFAHHLLQHGLSNPSPLPIGSNQHRDFCCPWLLRKTRYIGICYGPLILKSHDDDISWLFIGIDYAPGDSSCNGLNIWTVSYTHLTLP